VDDALLDAVDVQPRDDIPEDGLAVHRGPGERQGLHEYEVGVPAAGLEERATALGLGVDEIAREHRRIEATA
jgi:hypothetical protein